MIQMHHQKPSDPLKIVTVSWNGKIGWKFVKVNSFRDEKEAWSVWWWSNFAILYRERCLLCWPPSANIVILQFCNFATVSECSAYWTSPKALTRPRLIWLGRDHEHLALPCWGWWGERFRWCSWGWQGWWRLSRSQAKQAREIYYNVFDLELFLFQISIYIPFCFGFLCLWLKSLHSLTING